MPEYITLFFLFQRMNYSIYGKCHPKSPEVTYLSIAETGAQVLAARASMSCRTWASQSSLRGKEEFRLFALLLVLPPRYADNWTPHSQEHVYLVQKKNKWMPIPDSLWACRWQSRRNTLSVPQQAKTHALNISHLKTFNSMPAVDPALILRKLIKLHQGSIWFFRWFISMVNMLLFSLPFEYNYCSSPWL